MCILYYIHIAMYRKRYIKNIDMYRYRYGYRYVETCISRNQAAEVYFWLGLAGFRRKGPREPQGYSGNMMGMYLPGWLPRGSI